jgi:hypothetical protein
LDRYRRRCCFFAARCDSVRLTTLCAAFMIGCTEVADVSKRRQRPFLCQAARLRFLCHAGPDRGVTLRRGPRSSPMTCQRSWTDRRSPRNDRAWVGYPHPLGPEREWRSDLDQGQLAGRLQRGQSGAPPVAAQSCIVLVTDTANELINGKRVPCLILPTIVATARTLQHIWLATRRAHG